MLRFVRIGTAKGSAKLRFGRIGAPTASESDVLIGGTMEE